LRVVEGGRRERWVRGVWEVDGKIMGCGGRDLNRSRESRYPEGERSPSSGRTFARRSVCVCGRGRTFVHGRLARERTIAQCWANVRFISVCSTIESTSANDRPGMGERSLHQCV
jgi:hypothetical protein